MKGLKKCSRSAQDMDPRLVILSRGPGLYSTKQLVKEAEKEEWAVRVVDPLKLTVLIDDGGGRIYYKGWPLECEAVIPRIGHSITRRGVSIVRQFERMGVIVINESDGIANSRDKLVACQLMAEAGVPVPITANVGAWEDTVRAVNQVGGTPCVIKSNEGTHGSGVFLAHTEQQARQLVYQMLERDMRPLVQEYIQESHGQDVRALVVGGKVVAAMRRKALSGDPMLWAFRFAWNRPNSLRHVRQGGVRLCQPIQWCSHAHETIRACLELCCVWVAVGVSRG